MSPDTSDKGNSNKVYQFDQSPPARVARLRKEARGTPAGVKRDQLLRRARQIEAAAPTQDRLNSPDLKPPT
jgi:hypothetical protein